MQSKGNVQKFCDDSTMHGFKELYYARNCVWKSFWTLIILGATAITCYQVYDSIIFYCNQPTVISVYPLEEDIQTPNIDFCFHNKYVFAWMTLDTGILNNETDEYFFHFLSKLTGLANLDVYYSNTSYYGSSSYFTYGKETQAQIELYKNDYDHMLAKNNITNEIFYARRFIAKSPNVLILRKNKKTYFNPIKSTFVGNYICYTYTLNVTNRFEIGFPLEVMQTQGSDFMSHTIPSNQHGSLTMNMLRNSYPELFPLTSKSYFKTPLKALNDLQNDTANLLQLIKFGIGNVQAIIFRPEISYDIRLGVNKFKYMNRASKPCTDENGIQSFLLQELLPNNNLNSNYSCYNFCMYRKRNVSSCINVDLANGLQNNQELEVKICEPDTAVCNNNTKCSQLTEVDEDESIDEECRMKCPNQCTQWIYLTATHNVPSTDTPTADKFFSSIDVTFPFSSSVLVSEEQNAFTWTTLIGNIGGLLGLWLGASLLSFLQTFYLLLCPPKNAVEETSKQIAAASVTIQKSNAPSLQSNKTESFQIT